MGTDIKLKDLYNDELPYENISTVAIPKADNSGEAEFYVKRPVINYALLDPPTRELTATTDIYFAANGTDGNVLWQIAATHFLGVIYAPVEGKTTKPIVYMQIKGNTAGLVANSTPWNVVVYLYEELPGAVLLEVLNQSEGATDFTAQVGWGQLMVDVDEKVTGYAKIDNPTAVTIGIEQPNDIRNADIFYSLLSEVTQDTQSVDVTENGEQTIVPTAGKSGIRKVALNVNVAGGGGGVQPDWNQNDSTAADFVKNRPGAFQVPAKDAVTITWDGVIGDKESVDVSALVGRSATLVKVSDEVLYPPHVYNATLTMKYAGNDVTLDILQGSSDVTYLAEYGCTEIFGVYIISFSRDISLFGMSFSSGTWFLKLNDANYAKQISTVASAPLDFDTGVYVPIDGRYVNFGVVEQYGQKLKIGVHSGVGSGIGATIGSGLTMEQENGLAVGKYNSSYSKLFVVGKGISASSRSDAFSVDEDGKVDVGWQLEVGGGGIVLKSSTAGSTKKFKITVDDTGTLTATEVTN